MPHNFETTKKTIPSLEDVVKHPAYPTAMWQLEPHQSGLLDVGHGVNISWEVHGEGPIKLVFLCGLGFLKTAWQRQTLYFAHSTSPPFSPSKPSSSIYSVLLIDNRGMGLSSTPLCRYSTSIMANDTLAVLNHLGWISSSSPPTRNLHIAGLSMGGMIAQELALLIPDHIASLNLCCTAAAIKNTVGFFENLINRITMLLPKSPDRSVQLASRLLFPGTWLDEPDDALLPNVDDPSSSTTNTTSTPNCKPPLPSAPPLPPLSPQNDDTPTTTASRKYLHFPTNYHRFAAQEHQKQTSPHLFARKGFLLQLVAAGWHHKSARQLSGLADRVGRDRILVLHGTEDRMITLPHGHELCAGLGLKTDVVVDNVGAGAGAGAGARAGAVIVEGMGHGPIVERAAWFNELLAGRIKKGEELCGR